MLHQSCWNNLVTGLIVPTSLLQFVNSLFQTCSNKFGTSSANTFCQQLVNRLVTTCLQVCSNLCVFTCVGINMKSKITMTSMKITITTDIKNREWNHDIQEEPEDYQTGMKVEILKRYFNSQLTLTVL